MATAKKTTAKKTSENSVKAAAKDAKTALNEIKNPIARRLKLGKRIPRCEQF